MSEIKLPAASGRGSISIKGPASSGSDVDLLDTSGNLNLADGKKLILGTGDDFQIHHDGSGTNLDCTNSNPLYIQSDLIHLMREDGNEWYMKCTKDAAVELYHNNSKKLETTSTGITVSGRAQIDGNCFPYSDNASDLGLSSNRWQDLYLSGNMYLGGTGSANALDDYEEGTFTPKLGGDNNYSTYNITGTGTYVKIGTWVHVTIRFHNQDLNNSASGNAFLYDMPFTSGNNPTNGVAGVTTNYETYGVDFSGSHRYGWYISGNTTNWRGLASVSGSAWSDWGIGDWDSTLYMDFSGSYRTS